MQALRITSSCMGAMNDRLSPLGRSALRVNRRNRHGVRMTRPEPLRTDAYNSVPTIEQFYAAMSRCLMSVENIHDAAARCAAYERAGYASEQIIEHDLECKRREIQRRAIFGMKERAVA